MTTAYRELGARLSNWGRWGSEDQLGTLNLLTPERRAAAHALVRSGETFDLSLALQADGPQTGDGPRTNPVHTMTRLPSAPPAPGGFHYFDDALFLHLQGGTQLDALSHVAYDGRLYNDTPISAITAAGAGRLGVETVGGAISGRGVLLDIPRSEGRPLLADSESITVAHLERAERRAGVRVGAGDLLLVRTGWLSVFTQHRDRERFFASEPGLALEVAGWLRERDVAFVAMDNWGVEAAPAAGDVEMPLHCVLIRDMGMPLGEMFELDALAEHVQAHARATFHLTCAPLKIPGAVGSPLTPVATF